MAKKSAIEKNERRRKLVKKFTGRRMRLRAIARDKSLPMEDRFAAALKLAVSAITLAGFAGSWVALNHGHDREAVAQPEAPAALAEPSPSPSPAPATAAPSATTGAPEPTPTTRPAVSRGRQSRGS